MVVYYDSFGQDSTGLPMVIWIGDPCSSWARHNFKPQVKVAPDYFHNYWRCHRTISFYVHPQCAKIAGKRFCEYEAVRRRLTEEDKQYVLDFIAKNWEPMVLYWYGFMDTMALIERLEPVAIRPDHPYLVNVQKYNLSSDEKGSLETMHRIVIEGP
jgi:hypothetical protein